MAAAAQILAARLGAEEGERLFPYDDATGVAVRAPVGKLTWGRGFNLMQCGSPRLFDVMEQFLIAEVEAQLLPLPWYQQLNPVRQSVVLDIGYNAGVHGLLGFHRMIGALEVGDWATAAKECAVIDPKLNASRYAPLRALILSG